MNVEELYEYIKENGCDNIEIIDCHYCKYAYCINNKDFVDCYAEDNYYFVKNIKDSKAEAKECELFEFDGGFPKL